MAELAGATHALEESIWHKPLPVFQDDRTYFVVWCNPITGGVVSKRWGMTGEECRDAVRRNDLAEDRRHMFAHEEKEKGRWP